MLARLLPDGHRSDPEIAADYREMTESALRSGKTDDLAMVRATLPDGGGELRLDDDQAAAWLRTSNDLRLALGTRLDITEDSEPPDDVTTEEDSSSRSTTGSPACRVRSSTHWSPLAPAEGEHDQRGEQQVEDAEDVDRAVQLHALDQGADRRDQHERREHEHQQQEQRAARISRISDTRSDGSSAL